tara:strand:- start:623 stop:1789 length:1167 start_codon:yes stop_codon:yes gene_type:complete
MKKFKLSSINIDGNDISSLLKTIKSGWLAYGEQSKLIENVIKKKFKVKNVILCNSCTSGIYASLKALGIKKNDEVLVSSFTFISTINSLFQLGAKIKLVDINTEDYNICLKDLRKKITKKTKVILPTHYGGNPIDIDNLKKVVNSKKIQIVEDAATALGSKVGGKYTGAGKNSISVFSLYSNKIISTAEGGIVFCENKKIAKKIKTLVSMGINRDTFERDKSKKWMYDLEYPGYKFNFTDMQSSLLKGQIKRLDKIIEYRKLLRNKYMEYLRPSKQNQLLSFTKIKKNHISSNYIFTILLNIKNLNISRNDLMNKLTRKGVQTSVHYIPCYKMKFYKKFFYKSKLINTDIVFNGILSLPFHNKLSIKDVRFISKIINKILLTNKKKNN